MIQLLWGILNIWLVLFFIVICFKASRLVRDNIGYLAAVVFVFGLYSFMGNKNSNLNPKSSWDFASKDSLITDINSSINIKLEETRLTTLALNIYHGYRKTDQQNIPISAYSSFKGFVSGLNWKPTSISIYKTSDNNKFQYYVNGILEWQLIGATIYSQPKNFEDIVTIR